MLASYGWIMLPKLFPEHDYTACWQLQVSDQTRDGGSFFGLPKRTRRMITEWLEGAGYTISETLEGRTLRAVRPGRKKQYSQQEVPDLGIDLLESVPTEEVDDGTNVSRSWSPRFKLNLYTIEQMCQAWRERGKTVRFYNVATGMVMDQMLSLKLDSVVLRCLLSYYYLTRENEQHVTNAVRSER